MKQLLTKKKYDSMGNFYFDNLTLQIHIRERGRGGGGRERDGESTDTVLSSTYFLSP